ncbi:MAG: UDP-N-acetylmuramate--L-alanine ligase [Rikenellaceae bacterium]
MEIKELDKYTSYYFIGIGGIGMSALARLFLNDGKKVAGYDRVLSPLTQELEDQGIKVHYNDDISLIESEFKDKKHTMVVYTPAVPSSHSELNFFIDNGFTVVKRSKMLGVVSHGKYLMAVAGTHGKTSTSTMLAHLNKLASTDGDGSAVLGGISRNYGSNLILGKGKRLTVEADEFDRSFLQLYPNVALITSTDSDHLDIYGTHEEFAKGFGQFASQVKDTLIYRSGIDLVLPPIRCFSYGTDERSDFYAINMSLQQSGCYDFDVVMPDRIVKNIHLGIPGRINVENCVGAMAMMWVAGFDEAKAREALASFRGVKRRFEIYINTPNRLYIDDYAHHPTELRATIESVRAMYPGRHLTIAFQPHLYSRTRDFAQGFAESLSLSDRTILIPIYPAREEPIEGVTSGMLLDMITISDKRLIDRDKLVDEVAALDCDIFISFGAGDIGLLSEEFAKKLKV